MFQIFNSVQPKRKNRRHIPANEQQNTGQQQLWKNGRKLSSCFLSFSLKIYLTSFYYLLLASIIGLLPFWCVPLWRIFNWTIIIDVGTYSIDIFCWAAKSIGTCFHWRLEMNKRQLYDSDGCLLVLHDVKKRWRTHTYTHMHK